MEREKVFKDHYATLGIDPRATRKEIRDARNRLLRRHHPDLHTGSGSDSATKAKERTIDILLAAKVLLDDDARREYDRTYHYVRGRTETAPAAEPAAKETPERGLACGRCGRKNSWGRTYCIYCGAGLGEGAPGFHVEDMLSRDLTRDASAGAYVHFGCGALVGLVVFAGLGGELLAESFDSGFPLAVWMAIGALAFGLLAVRFRDRFSWTQRDYDPTYHYVRGRTETAPAAEPAAKETPERGLACGRCGRKNSWGRTYCIYCGAGLGEGAPGFQVEDTLSRDLTRDDPAGAYVHFGCGALLGLVVFAVFGGQIIARSFDSAFPLAVWMAIGALALGLLAARFRDHFWWNLADTAQFFPYLFLVVLVLILPILPGTQTGRDHGLLLLALAIGVPALGVWVLWRNRRFGFAAKRRRRRRRHR